MRTEAEKDLVRWNWVAGKFMGACKEDRSDVAVMLLATLSRYKKAQDPVIETDAAKQLWNKMWKLIESDPVDYDDWLKR